MPVELTWDPEVDPGLFARLVALWVEVTNAGGSVGFVGPVVAADVGPTAQRALATVAEGADRLLVAHDGPRLVGALFVCSAQFHLMEHWRTLKRLMVSPGAQRGGVGSLLLAAAAGQARDPAGAGCASRYVVRWGWKHSTNATVTARSVAFPARSASDRATTATRSPCGLRWTAEPGCPLEQVRAAGGSAALWSKGWLRSQHLSFVAGCRCSHETEEFTHVRDHAPAGDPGARGPAQGARAGHARGVRGVQQGGFRGRRPARRRPSS